MSANNTAPRIHSLTTTYGGGSSSSEDSRCRGRGQWRGQWLLDRQHEQFLVSFCPSHLRFTDVRTHARRILAVEVLLAVPPEETLGLGLGGRSTGEPLVKLANVGHAGGVGVRTKGLNPLTGICQPLCRPSSRDILFPSSATSESASGLQSLGSSEKSADVAHRARKQNNSSLSVCKIGVGSYRTLGEAT